ncbi:hypothetical protein OAI97_03015 [Nitrosopumilus sp.]|nr:hypothetical protein [Nitrosopumilus sp.]
MPDELFLNSFNSQFYTTKYKLDSFKNNEDGNLETFCYLTTRKVIGDRKLEELLKRQNFPENQNKNFKEIQEQIHSLCGDVYFSKNHFGAAIEQYKSCLKYNSGNIHAIIGLANSFQSLGLDGLSGKTFAQSKEFYAWEKTFFDKNSDDEQDYVSENSDDVGNDEFQYIPKNLLFNIAILEKSKRIFQYIADSEPSIDFPESYIFIDDDLSFEEHIEDNVDNKISKLINNFPQLEKIKKDTKTQFKKDSKPYKINSKNISRTTTLYSCIPNEKLKSKKISSLYFSYLLSGFTENSILDKIRDELKIIIEPDNYPVREDLNKVIFKHWLECVGDKKSLLSMNMSDDTLSLKQKIDGTISTGQIIKALNQQWDGFSPETICHNITSKNIAKILTESVEDYVKLYNSNKKVKDSTNFNLNSGPGSLLEMLQDKLQQMSVAEKPPKTRKNTPKNTRKDPMTYAKLHARIKKLRTD